jgi:hypothetical protein
MALFFDAEYIWEKDVTSLSAKVTILRRYGPPLSVDVVLTFAIFSAMMSVLNLSAVIPEALMLND